MYCDFITSVSISLRHCPSLRELNISDTAVTAAGSMGLDEIGTLQCLKARGRTQLDASTLPLSIIARGRPEQLKGDRCRLGRAGRPEHAANTVAVPLA
jgi:hypothetical protein